MLPVKHLSLVSVAGDEAVNFDGLVLSDPVATSLCLQVILRVPVGVIDDHCVSS